VDWKCRSGSAQLDCRFVFESRLPPEAVLSAGFADLLAAILICPAVSANLFAGYFLAAICACREGAACMSLLSAFATAGRACAVAERAPADTDVPAFSRWL